MGAITRYSDDNIITYENVEIFEIRDKIDTTENESDLAYNVQEGDDLKGIANIVYGDARLYWIIAEYNRIVDPFKNLVVGTRLIYPSMKRVREEIL